MNQKGFTFVELILYISIVLIVVTSVITLGLMVIETGVKSETQQELADSARYLSERLKLEIRNSSDINTGSSNFGINLATDQTKQLSLAKTDVGANPTLINVLNGKVQIKQGGGPVLILNSDGTTVTDLTFTNNTSIDLKTKNISYTLTIESRTVSSKYQYQGSISLRSSDEIRSN